MKSPKAKKEKPQSNNEEPQPKDEKLKIKIKSLNTKIIKLTQIEKFQPKRSEALPMLGPITFLQSSNIRSLLRPFHSFMSAWNLYYSTVASLVQIESTIDKGVHPPKPMMYIAYLPYFSKIYKSPIFSLFFVLFGLTHTGCPWPVMSFLLKETFINVRLETITMILLRIFLFLILRHENDANVKGQF